MQLLQRIVIPAMLALGSSFALCAPASAQSSLFSESIVGVNDGTYIDTLDGHFANDNSTVSANITNMHFKGMDGLGNPQTEIFSGTTIARSDYGSLHCLTSGSLLNSYYNVNNPAYADNNGNTINAAGSPRYFSVLGFAIFNDTLQFGGALQSGYMARYIFHIDGTNSGTGAAVDMGVTVDPGLHPNDPNFSDAFFDFNSGSLNTNWATKDFAINGVTPQTINIQFSDQVTFDTSTFTDGQDYTGQSDFSSTATLTGIELVDQNGNLASGWTVTSASGTHYNAIQGTAVPEPGSVMLLVGFGITAGVCSLKRRRSRA